MSGRSKAAKIPSSLPATAFLNAAYIAWKLAVLEAELAGALKKSTLLPCETRHSSVVDAPTVLSIRLGRTLVRALHSSNGQPCNPTCAERPLSPSVILAVAEAEVQARKGAIPTSCFSTHRRACLAASRLRTAQVGDEATHYCHELQYICRSNPPTPLNSPHRCSQAHKQGHYIVRARVSTNNNSSLSNPVQSSRLSPTCLVNRASPIGRISSVALSKCALESP